MASIALYSTRLTSLMIDSKNIISLQPMSQLRSLRTLHAQNCRDVKTTLPSLVSAPCRLMKSLNFICLGGPGLDDGGLMSLASLVSLRMLLVFNAPNITEVGFVKLCSSHPCNLNTLLLFRCPKITKSGLITALTHIQDTMMVLRVVDCALIGRDEGEFRGLFPKLKRVTFA
eukprot:PhF_6_TR28131/c3_g4_i1/m.41624